MSVPSDEQDLDLKPFVRRGKKDPRETAQRLIRVEQMLAAQFDRLEIERRVSKEYKVTERQVRRDFHKIYAQWDEQAKKEKPIRRHQLRQTMRAILRKALADNDGRLALKAAERLAALDGLHEAIKTEVAIKGALSLQGMKSQDKRRELEKLMAKYAAETPTNGKSNGKANGHSHDEPIG